MKPPIDQTLPADTARLLRISRWLDAGLRLPGTRITLGAEALLGLVPVVGDIAGLLLSLWLVAEAHRAGAPKHLVNKMLGNALLDAGAGALPVVGDLFDFWFRANQRNAELLREHFQPESVPAPKKSLWPRVIALVLTAIAAVLWWYLARAS